MVAEDYADSKHNAKAIYECIRLPLLSQKVPSDRKLPLVYVVDSILKNVKGKYNQIIEDDAKTWMPVVYDRLPENKRAKLKKVWNLWKDSVGFQEANWKEMGSCFAPGPALSSSSASSSSTNKALGATDKMDVVAGITRAVRGRYYFYTLVTLALRLVTERTSLTVYIHY
jgi:pre-mRNA cleavage complex 2 protein Pcf11